MVVYGLGRGVGVGDGGGKGDGMKYVGDVYE